MSLERKHNTFEHRMLRVRQNPLENAVGNGPESEGGKAASESSPAASTPSAASPTVSTPSATPSTAQQPPTTSTQETSSTPAPQTSSSSSPIVTPTTSSSTPTPTSTSTSTSLSTSSSSSSTSSTISSTASSSSSTASIVTPSTSTSTHIVTGAIEQQQTSSFGTASRAATSAAGSTVSASSTAVATSGAINTGAIVGGIAGGLIAVALLGFIIAFFLRRRSRRAREVEFDAAQYRKSAMILDDEAFAPVPRPSEMIQNRMNVVPSTGSIVGAGMAGAGAYKFQGGQQQTFEPYHDETPRTAEYGTSAFAQPPSANQPLQPRQQYTFGQTYEPSASNAALGAGVGVGIAAAAGAAYAAHEYHDNEPNGAYSSEPQATDVYDPEMYGNYHAYSTDGATAQGLTAGNRASVATVADDAYGGI